MKLTATDQDRLDRQPWLAPFIEPDDVSLDAAERRWQDATDAAWAEVRDQHRDVYKRMRVRGLETTALALGETEDR